MNKRVRILNFSLFLVGKDTPSKNSKAGQQRCGRSKLSTTGPARRRNDKVSPFWGRSRKNVGNLEIRSSSCCFVGASMLEFDNRRFGQGCWCYWFDVRGGMSLNGCQSPLVTWMWSTLPSLIKNASAGFGSCFEHPKSGWERSFGAAWRFLWWCKTHATPRLDLGGDTCNV